ncbi:metalloregulator ArsR/SmtB family transcription factor [Gammaproteobacteria bacterium]|nr:metalloregulator ArsR/SmtB family transcription factor [Gammaproteobacteria bacterium]
MHASIQAPSPTQDQPVDSNLADEDIALIAKALSHPVRIQIIRLLLSKKTCIGGDIVDVIGLAQSTVSEHLRILKTSGIIIGEITHPRVCYSLNPPRLNPIKDFLGLILDSEAETPDVDSACWVSPEKKQ